MKASNPKHGMKHMILAVSWMFLPLVCLSICGAASAQSRTQGADAVYMVPDPQTARWSYKETDAVGKHVATVYHSVESLEGDAINGTLKLRVEKVSQTSPADTTRSLIFYRFKDGEYMVDMNALFEGDILADIVGSAIEETTSDVSEQEMQEAVEKMKSQFKISGEIRGIPRYPTVGKLPDYEFQFKYSIMSVKVLGERRRIVGTERVRTQAGEFDCFVLEETITTKAMMMKDVEKTRSWYAYGIGLVKEITYDKNGELVSTMILNGINW